MSPKSNPNSGADCPKMVRNLHKPQDVASPLPYTMPLSLQKTVVTLLVMGCGLSTTWSQGTRCTDESWAATNAVNAPSARSTQTAVWTGHEMIVWGGAGPSFQNNGGRYNPFTDSWTTIPSGPEPRRAHTAVWTGTEMIVWGGFTANLRVNTGGKYNPVTGTWTSTSTLNAPTARASHTAIWTGNEMIVWGGQTNNGANSVNGGRYNPVTDTWTPMSTVNVPEDRYSHTAVWTGTEMIVWGGQGSSTQLDNGGRYNPATDTWTPVSITNAPTGRLWHTAVWTGSEMIVWGGAIPIYPNPPFNTGGRYNPVTDTWIPTNTINAPAGTEFHTAIWTGNEMVVWGGTGTGVSNGGGRYSPENDRWTPIGTTSAPTGRYNHTAIWTGNQMIVWGGYTYVGDTYFNTGGRYCAQPSTTPTQTPTPSPAPPCSRQQQCL